MDVFQIIGLVIAALTALGGLFAWGWNVATKLGRLVTLVEGIAIDQAAHCNQLDNHENRLVKLECRNPPPQNQPQRPRPSPA